jgi:hypothetical protein
MRLKFTNNVFLSFDLMIALAANKLIMRLKLKKALLANINIMIVLATNKLIMRSKVFMHRWLIIRAKN